MAIQFAVVNLVHSRRVRRRDLSAKGRPPLFTGHPPLLTGRPPDAYGGKTGKPTEAKERVC
ncbi:MAG: hypothetical protein LBK82_00415 [Planctomycetaceae bacterium]|nr:hypothetical protein [Planctomycetaceae bacterium]